MKKTFKEAKEDFYMIAFYLDLKLYSVKGANFTRRYINNVRLDMNYKVENLIKLTKNKKD